MKEDKKTSFGIKDKKSKSKVNKKRKVYHRHQYELCGNQIKSRFLRKNGGEGHFIIVFSRYMRKIIFVNLENVNNYFESFKDFFFPKATAKECNWMSYPSLITS